MKASIAEKIPFVPPERLFNFFREKDYFIWLDTCLNGRGGGRYSVIAFDPFLKFKSRRKRITVCRGADEKSFPGDPLESLDNLLAQYRVSCQGFFSPGALGYFSYDLGRQIEKLPDTGRDDLNIPDICLGFYDTLLLINHNEKSMQVVSANLKGETEKSFNLAFREKINLLKNLPVCPERAKIERPADIKEISSNVTYKQYVRAIEKVKDYIAKGDVYQINFAQRLQAEGSFSPEGIYAKLRRINPTLYSGYFRADDLLLLSNSPEIFIKKEGGRVVTVPMKGTMPRGMDRKQDRAYKRQLLQSVKDKAELVMIVDLERNDLGRVCRYGTVQVTRLRQVESYGTVFQTTSTVEGILKDGITLGGLLRASFPGGSITGAPKIRAMEIIEELEPDKRAFYTGSMGYVGFNGNVELNILIRTMLLKKNRLYYPVGGGIVWDSTPEAEYEETMTKAKAFFLAVGQAPPPVSSPSRGEDRRRGRWGIQ